MLCFLTKKNLLQLNNFYYIKIIKYVATFGQIYLIKYLPYPQDFFLVQFCGVALDPFLNFLFT